jgi:alpha-glucosidase (family GH31 glycosyl hydrolase)
MDIEVLKESVFHLFSFPSGSALNRYGFLENPRDEVHPEVEKNHGRITVKTKKVIFSEERGRIEMMDKKGSEIFKGEIKVFDEGGEILINISEDEKFFGLGDIGRERIERRGMKADMWIKNVISYIPIPFLMSSKGYGIFINTTFRHCIDIGNSNPNRLKIFLPKGNLDIYFFYGPSYKEILQQYTEITGRPVLPPKWSFGLWFICRMYANDFEVMSDALNFRDRKIPCDVIGLEPGWMEKLYDYSTEKKWHPDRFPIPPYAPNGPHTFISALKRMGFKLELWLCNDYDLSYEAERRIGNDIVKKKEEERLLFLEDDKEKDIHFTAPIMMDNITKPDEPWFEHLKKFIDQGVDFFKQDGALQVCEHPDRKWANGMSDEEMHNLYPLLYSQQMYEGFKEYTGRRPCCFTPAGWAGLQRYTGTWTGDTGGGEKTLVACLNLALSGHSLVTCDMEVTTKEGIHYGFLMPWAQVNSWNYFRHPWLLGDDLFSIFLEYAQLRSRLIPYLYTYAYLSHITGIPMMRPLLIEYPDDTEAPYILNEYFLGKELLVTAFSENIYLPSGRWCDFWTGKIYEGPKRFRYEIPEKKGGGLFIREGSILPLGPIRQYVREKTEEGFTLHIFLEPGNTAYFDLYDDDGETFDYQKGKFIIYHIKAIYSKSGRLDVDIPEGLKIEKIVLNSGQKPEYVFLNGREFQQVIYR